MPKPTTPATPESLAEALISVLTNDLPNTPDKWASASILKLVDLCQRQFKLLADAEVVTVWQPEDFEALMRCDLLAFKLKHALSQHLINLQENKT